MSDSNVTWEPSWDDAPEWAIWWAVDSTLTAQWFDRAPYMYITVDYAGWLPQSRGGIVWGRYMVEDNAVDLPIGVDWRTTLRKRPEVSGE